MALALLYLSWPACLIHRFWNNKPRRVVSWFTFNNYKQDIQWYIYDTGNMISWLFILLAFCVMKNKTPSIRIVLYAITLIQFIDIFHYWLWYKQNEVIVTMEGMIMILTSILIIYHKWKKV